MRLACWHDSRLMPPTAESEDARSAAESKRGLPDLREYDDEPPGPSTHERLAFVSVVSVRGSGLEAGGVLFAF